MKKVMISLTFLMILSICPADAEAGGRETVKERAEIRKHRKLLDAIRLEETRGEPNGGRDARGKAGELGPYQIKRDYWIDSGMKGSFNQVRDKRYAERTVVRFWDRYATSKRVGKQVGDYHRAAMHNRGPTQWSDSRGRSYWGRVKSRMR